MLQVAFTGIIAKNKANLEKIEKEISALEIGNLEKEKDILEKSSCNNILQAKDSLVSINKVTDTNEIAYVR